MPGMPTRAALLAALLSCAALANAQAPETTTAAAPASREQIAALEQRASQARQQEDWAALLDAANQLHQQRPFVPAYMVEGVRAAAALGKREAAYQYMLKLQQSGLSYDMNQVPQTAPMRDTEAYQYINDLMLEAAQPVGSGRDFLSLPGHPSDIGDLAWDETRQRFLLGTLREGKLFAVADDGSTELLLQADADNGLWSIGGIAVDAPNGALWIASFASPGFVNYSPADARRGGLFRFDLETLEPQGQYNLSADGLPHQLGSVAVTAAGDVYVLDRVVPIVYRKSAGGDSLEHFIGMPRLVTLTDLAVTPDNSRLFIADAVMGILVVDPIAGQSAMLGGPANLNLYGVFGLDYVDSSLVVTQSGINPQRIMRFKLDAAGAAVEGVTPMAVALEGFDTPGIGTLRGDSLYYFANHGTRSNDERMRMMVTPLESGEEIKSPDMRLFERAMRERMEELEQQQKQEQDKEPPPQDQP